MFPKYLPLVFVGLLSMLMLSCAQVAPPETSSAPTAPAATPSPTAEAAAPTVSLKFALTPWEDDEPDDYNDIAALLAEHTGYEIQPVQITNYQQGVELIANGEVELAALGAGGFVAAEQLNPDITMLVTELYWNEAQTERISSYTSRIITLSARDDIAELADLAGLRFGFVEEESTSGFVVPNFLMQQQGIDYETFFEEVFFLGTHENIIDAVAAGSVDAGAVYDEMVNYGQTQHGDIFKVILESPPIPSAGVAVHPSVPSDIQETLQAAFLSFTPEALAVDRTDIAGYTTEAGEFYDLIRDMVDAAAE